MTRPQMKLISQIQYNKYAMAGNDWPWHQIAGHGSHIQYNKYAMAANDWPWVDPGHSWPWPTMASQFPSKACQLQTATRLFSFCKLLRKHVWPGHHPVPAVLGTGTGLVTSPPPHHPSPIIHHPSRSSASSVMPPTSSRLLINSCWFFLLTPQLLHFVPMFFSDTVILKL